MLWDVLTPYRKTISRKMISTQRILAAYPSENAEWLTELLRLSGLSARTSLCGLIWTRSRIRIHMCGGVGCSMLAFLYLRWGKALCRHFPLRTWSVYGTTVLEVLQSHGTTTVCWYLNVSAIEVYALIPKTLNLFTPPSGIIVIFI